MNSKKTYERAIKKSVSMPEILFDDAERRRRDLRLSTMSDYFQYLVRRDTERDSSLQLARAA